ncbi:ty3-gypsy retrotransposon protein [Tanacetum coccineum]
MYFSLNILTELVPAKSDDTTPNRVVSTGAFIAMADLEELRLLIKEQVAANKKQAELPHSMRLDVAKFSGNDPDSWIFSITKYFYLLATPADQRLRIDFVKSVHNRFGPCKYEDPQRALSKLLQTGTVAQYHSEFEKLMNRVTDISKNLLISFYVSGLKPNLQRELLVAKPTSLGDAFSLARVTEAGLEDQGTIVSTAKVTTVPKATTTRFVSPHLENPKSPLLPTPPKGGVATGATPLLIKWISQLNGRKG